MKACRLNPHIYHLLQGVKLLVKRGACYFYRGPNVFPAWELDQIVKYGNETKLKICRVALKTIKVPSHLFSKKARKRMRRMRRGDGSKYAQHANALMKRVDEVKAKLPPGYEMTAEQSQSLHHLAAGTICKCGHKEMRIVRGKEQMRAMGFHRRYNCKKCPGCIAPKCGECKNCLVPSNKQACTSRRCMFPRTPDCPDFE